MPTAMPKSNTIEFDSAKRLKQDRQYASELQVQHQSLKLQLSSVLQSSLELEQVLKFFYEELRSLVQFSGMFYTHDNQLVTVNLGKKATHSCGYRITTSQDHLGELTFYRGKRFSENELELIEDLLGSLISPLRNTLKYREALIASLTDPLTGAGNRLSLDNTLRREIELAKRHRSPFSILIIDIDNFKEVNDQHGHRAGDKVLKGVSESLAAVNRQTDLVFRYGGEEFVVLLNKTSLPGAIVIGERIRAAVELKKFKAGSKTLRITTSVGAANLRANDNKDRLFQRADKALYKAKKSGKNTVIGL